jgi:hypothetical protein
MLLKRYSVLIEVRFLNPVSKFPSPILDDRARQKERSPAQAFFASSDWRPAVRSHGNEASKIL